MSQKSGPPNATDEVCFAGIGTFRSTQSSGSYRTRRGCTFACCCSCSIIYGGVMWAQTGDMGIPQRVRMPLLMPDDFSVLHRVAWRVEPATPDPENPTGALDSAPEPLRECVPLTRPTTFFNTALCRAFWSSDRLYALVSSAGGPTIGTAVSTSRKLANEKLFVNIMTPSGKEIG